LRVEVQAVDLDDARVAGVVDELKRRVDGAFEQPARRRRPDQ